MNNYNYLTNNYPPQPSDPIHFTPLPQINLMPNTNMQLFTPKEALDRGNLFANLYDPYKNYQPVALTGKNEKEKLYLDFIRMAFAAHELNLYLDNFPNDQSMIQLFNDYRQKSDTLKNQYEQKYGPIDISSNALNTTPFAWVDQKWPWEGGI